LNMMAFLIVPPAVAFAVLILAPAGVSYLVALGLTTGLCVLAALAIYPLRPSSGPDDWFHGVEQIPLWGVVAAVAVSLPFQGWRWWRISRGHPSHYVAILAGAAVLVGGWFLLMTVI
jgi:uncharacterized membrane protein YfbV (UPF0208 family)